MKIYSAGLVPFVWLLGACATPTPPAIDSGFDATEANGADVPHALDTPNVDSPNATMDTGVCPAGSQMCVPAGCVDLQSNVSHCGACNSACVFANATPQCTNGACGLTACNAGFANCDTEVATGCEINVQGNVAHCGGCGVRCPTRANATPLCTGGVCSITCELGFELLGDRCVVAGAFPRPTMPISLGDVSLLRPTLRWELPAETDGAMVDLCLDRACTAIIETLRAPGASVRPSMALPARSVVFWRLRATVGMSTSTAFSPTWLFHVPAISNTGDVDTSSNPHLDVNGDGYDDLVVGARFADPAGRINAGTASVYHGGVSGISANPARVLEGVTASDFFGNSVAGAGDVNGDGFGDVLIGAFFASPMGGAPTGTASVFHGGLNGVALAPARVLLGVAMFDQFGYSVAGAGDLNGDGYADVVIGAYQAAGAGGLRAGTASVFHGSAGGVLGDSARVLQGVAAGDSFGYSVAGAGDLNGDGFSDVVVGAFQAIPAALASAGTASVYYGSVSGVQLGATAVLEGRAASDYFGYSVASAGDVNGDGFGDLIVGAYQPSPGGRLRAGTASLFHGRADALSMRAERVIDGATAQDFFGFSVASAGDVNGDGFGDVVIGATRASPGGRANAGAVSVYLGTLNGVAMAPARVLEDSAESDAFGGAVMGVGDLNGDGFADLVVGANSASPGGLTNAGTATVFHGSLTGIPALPARVLEGASALEQFGFSVASVGDRLGLRRRMRIASL